MQNHSDELRSIIRELDRARAHPEHDESAIGAVNLLRAKLEIAVRRSLAE